MVGFAIYQNSPDYRIYSKHCQAIGITAQSNCTNFDMIAQFGKRLYFC